MFGIDLLRNTIACLFLEWQLLFDVIFIVIYYSYIIHYKNRSIVTKDVEGTENLQSVFFCQSLTRTFSIYALSDSGDLSNLFGFLS